VSYQLPLIIRSTPWMMRFNLTQIANSQPSLVLSHGGLPAGQLVFARRLCFQCKPVTSGCTGLITNLDLG
jgi:hypothetical protein